MCEKISYVGFALVVAACAGTKRDEVSYRTDTQKVLDTRSPQIKACYDEALKVDPAATGTMTVRFTVAKKTGQFTRATLDAETSKAPEPLVLCVLNAIDGLKLEPPDKNDGNATFVYALTPGT